jgi:hypothetical protein
MNIERMLLRQFEDGLKICFLNYQKVSNGRIYHLHMTATKYFIFSLIFVGYLYPNFSRKRCLQDRRNHNAHRKGRHPYKKKKYASC